MLSVYTRHYAAKNPTTGVLTPCPYNADRNSKRCKCPKWIMGTLPNGKFVRCSAKTKSWERAAKLAAEMERAADAGQTTPETASKAITVTEAVAAFLEYGERVRRLQEATILKYRTMFTQLDAFLSHAGIEYVPDIDLALLSKFVAGWKVKALTAQKRQERLKTFWKFMLKREWVKKNVGSDLDPIEVRDTTPTLPFADEEIAAMVAAASEPRLKAFVLVSRWSGLRISDVIRLDTRRVQNGRVFLSQQQKTLAPVWVPVPPEVLASLSAVELLKGPDGKIYYFWNQVGKKEYAAEVWRQRLNRLFRRCGIEGGRPHRFRDSFACGMLSKGVPIEDVSKLLGHKSIRVTEKHYAPWIRARQERLEDSVRKAWS